jgi:hypothetical protein
MRTHVSNLSSRRSSRHRGTVYFVVMGMALLVGTIGVGALLAARSQVRLGASAADFATARLCARAGMEVALFKIRATPNWRTALGNGAWFNNVALGQGAFSVWAADPISGDVTLNTNHPVILTSTGTRGAASYKLQVTVQVGSTAVGCLDVNAAAASDLTLSGNCTLSSNQLVATNGNVSNGANCTLSAGVEAVGSFGGGGTYAGQQQSLAQPFGMPDPTSVFSYYTTNGTAIPYTALLQSNTTQLVSNPSFETNTTGWYVYSPAVPISLAAISKSTAQHQDGSASLLISGRLATGEVPATDLPLASVRNGDTYAVSVPVYAKASGTVQATLVLQASGGTTSVSTASVALQSSGGWVTCTGNLVPTWTGTLSKATLTLTCSNATTNLYVDKISVKDTSLPSSAYVMDRVVLSPGSNPYGTGANAQGIYVIDCAGKTVTIGPCRIVGTLVLLNPGSNTTLAGPISLEQVVPGYPVLMVNGALAVNFDKSVALSESTYGVNFNPTGSPYPYVGGTTDATTAGAYPSLINGVVYTAGDLTLSGNPAVTGNVISAGKIAVQATSLSLTYSNLAYTSPPPGFSSNVPAVVAQPGTWKRVTN